MFGRPGKDDGPEFDHRLVQVLAHPVRARFLELLAEREVLCPAEALERLDGSGVALSNVAYHVRVLDRFELVEPAGEADPARGVPFRATAAGRAALIALGLSSPEEGG
jgi:DNA-binding transcriptional ArsR family regulator